MEDSFHPKYKKPIEHLCKIRSDEIIAFRDEREKAKRLSALFEARVNKARRHFPSFMEYCFHDETTGLPFNQQWFHDEWSEAMDRSDRLIIVAPRDHGKTTFSVGRVIWELGRNHNLRVKIACASDGRSKERLFEVVQNIMYNRRVKEVFPDLRPSSTGEWSKHKIYIERKARHRDASIEALGITSTATGGRCDLLMADDVVDRRNALSMPALREQIKQAWKSDWTNLLEPGSRIWYICTLWHKDDLSHELLKNPTYMNLTYAVSEDFGSLWPEKWGTQNLHRRFLEIGSVEFNRAFRNIAVDIDSAVVKPQWIQYSDLRKNKDFVGALSKLIFFTSYDTAGTPSGRAEQDFASEVVLAVDVEKRIVYVVAASHYRKTVQEQAKRVVKSCHKYKPFRAIVEKASQAAVDEWVVNLDPVGAGSVLEVCKPTSQSKMTRLMGVTPLLEHGNVVFNATLDPDSEQWNPERGSLVNELLDFPLCRHDDMVDAFSQGLHAVRRYFLDHGAADGEPELTITVGNEGSEYRF